MRCIQLRPCIQFQTLISAFQVIPKIYLWTLFNGFASTEGRAIQSFALTCGAIALEIIIHLLCQALYRKVQSSTDKWDLLSVAANVVSPSTFLAERKNWYACIQHRREQAFCIYTFTSMLLGMHTAWTRKSVLHVKQTSCILGETTAAEGSS